MSMPTDPKDALPEADQPLVDRCLLENLIPIAPAEPQQETLRRALMTRIARSAAEHASFLTVRRKDGVWRDLKAGIRFKHLWAGPAGSSVLIEFEAGAVLPPHRHNWLEEGIVLRGGLQMGDLDMGPLDYHRSTAGSRHARIRSRQGALAFLRGTSLGETSSMWRELLGGLLPSRGDSHSVFATDEDAWVDVAEGVTKKELGSDGILSSRFYRLLPGARVPAHAHREDEECFMLQGEVFLGDVLLREGEYQLAPAGSRHGEVYTDVGAVLYVRSAADY